MTAPDTLASIAVVANSQTRFLMLAILQRLRQAHGSRVHLYCTTRQDEEFYRPYVERGEVDSVTAIGPLREIDTLDVSDTAKVQAEARAWEARLGCPYNTLAMADRHWGIGFALGGFHHPRSRQGEASYWQMLGVYNRIFDFWQNEVETKGVTLFLNGPKEVGRFAASRNLPFRQLFRSRYRGYHHWAVNEYREYPVVEAAYAALADEPVEPVELNQTYADESHRRKRLIAENDLPKMLRVAGYTALQHLYWRYRGYDKGKNYYFKDRVGIYFRRYGAFRRMYHDSLPRLQDLEGSPFVFYPLHTEPENALSMHSPEYFFQLGAIASLARDLPAGVKLAVKESITGLGRRPDNFYEQITAMKNVVLLNLLEPGHEIVKRAAAVATISGTAGFEAAVMGRPVISFGRHNGYNFLPHVHVITNETQLAPVLRKIFCDGIDLDQCRRDGARFLRAVVETSFDLGEYDYFNVSDFSPAATDAAYGALCDGLGVSESRA